MEGEVEAGVMNPILFPGSFSDSRKRDLPCSIPVFQQQLDRHWLLGTGIPNAGSSNGWNSKSWVWDSARFTATPSENLQNDLCLNTQGTAAVVKHGNVAEQLSKVMESGNAHVFLSKDVEDDCERLSLKLGGGVCAVEELVRPSKRVRSGSPGSGATYPMCQVDDCKENLSNSKDYHRRHKVCELHSKTAKALVGNQMQRFCQQCSRFHPLMEFDEGKRSCRRRLAGHNRRRRKTQPEDASPNMLDPESQDGKASGSLDIVNLLAILSRLQGNTGTTSISERDWLLQIIDKIGSLPSPNTASKTQVQEGFDLNVSETLKQISQASQQSFLKQPSQGSWHPHSPSTMNLLAVLSSALASTCPNIPTSLSSGSSDGGGNSSTRTRQDTIDNINSHNELDHILPPCEGRRAEIEHSRFNSSERQVQVATRRVPLQLFGSAEDDSPPNLGSASKYPSSQSSNPMEDGSPSSSPNTAKTLFPLHSEPGEKDKSRLVCKEDNVTAEASTTCGWASLLKPYDYPNRQFDNQTVQNLPYSGGYLSSSGSDQSPSSSNYKAQDRTRRITFKLFDKDPSNLPGTLGADILNWLSHSPSDIESYIRPGCVVLSIYLCMASMAWDELEEDFLERNGSLVNRSESGFWKNARFLVRTSRQYVSHNDGKIRLFKSRKTLSSPVLTSISPIAVVSGQETKLTLKGHKLTLPGTIIHCTYKGGYSSKEVLGSTYPYTIYDNFSSESFILPEVSPHSYGRYFIEVDNDFKGNSFPVIVADAAICKELRSIEADLDKDIGSLENISQVQHFDNGRLQSREDILHFLNELGWLFQRKSHPHTSIVDFSTSRFEYLFAFSVDRDFSTLVRKLLDILVERGCESDSVLHELLHKLQLLSRAVKRKCPKMVDLLLNYSVKNEVIEGSRMYLFPPNSAGSGGFTSLHLAASMKDAEDMVDALINDPQEIGLNCWASVMDDSGQSPFMYAMSRKNHSYNLLVARRRADKKNGQVSVSIEPVMSSKEAESPIKHGYSCKPTVTTVRSCGQCALAESRLVRISRSKGLLRRPHVHSVLAIAAVCVCVCLFLRGAPWVGSIAPFKWEGLDFGPR